MVEWISYRLRGYFNKYAYLHCVFLQHVFWVKSMDRYGDMVESSAISVCYLPTLSHFIVYLCLELMLPVQKITFARMLSLASLNLLGALALRMMYRYAYKCGNQKTVGGKILSILLRLIFRYGSWK